MPTKLWQHPENRTESPSAPAHPQEMNAGGAWIMALAGAAAIVLGILGLAGIVPIDLDGISVILLGGALVLGGALSAAASRPAPSPSDLGWGWRTTAGSFTAEVLLGLAGAFLGILALANVGTLNLIPIGVIALGIALWAGSAGAAQLGNAPSAPAGREGLAISGISGLGAAIGVGAIVLGILALLNVGPRLLTLISVIGVGFAILMTGAAAAREVARTA